MTAGERTFGLSTWLNKHVKLNAAGNVTITYPGKKGMINKHVIRGDTPERQALIDVITQLKENKKPNDPIWAEPDGAEYNAGDVRSYLKDLGFSGGAHKFRNAAGDDAWRKLTAEKPLKKVNPTPQEVDKYHKFITTKVGTLLGHQRTKKDGTTENVGSTAAKSYISPELQIQLFRDKKVPVPKWLEAVSDDQE
jgi:Eukaryotic DNA topoisomerase I, catalytic core